MSGVFGAVLKLFTGVGLLTLVGCASTLNHYVQLSDTVERDSVHHVHLPPVFAVHSSTYKSHQHKPLPSPRLSRNVKTTKPSKSSKPSHRPKFVRFSRIVCGGNVRIDYTGGYKRPLLNRPKASALHIWVKNGTLYLFGANTLHTRPPWVKIRAFRSIDTLSLMQQCRFRGRQVGSTGLDVTTEGQAVAWLRGRVQVRRITARGNSLVNMLWVHNKKLSVHLEDAAKVYLGGFVHQLYAKVFNQALFDGRYLRGKEIFVQTNGSAHAKVLPVQALRAFARDQSNIYFYRTPGPNLRLARHSGNVLQMGYWN